MSAAPGDIPTDTGRLAELLVELNLLNFGGGRLLVYRPEADTDHTDLVVHGRASGGHADLQVKAATHADAEERVVAFSAYPEHLVPESPYFLYVVVLYDHAAPERSRLWLVPSADFNRIAYREHPERQPGRVVLQFSCRLQGDPRWGRYEVDRVRLAGLVEAALGPPAPSDGR